MQVNAYKVGKQNKDMLIYKNTFWEISSAQDLLSFLRAAPKGQSSSSNLSNLSKLHQLPKRCKMLDVIIWKRHYLSDGRWSLQLLGPLVNNHLLPFHSKSRIKLKARLGYSATETGVLWPEAKREYTVRFNPPKHFSVERLWLQLYCPIGNSAGHTMPLELCLALF